MNQGSSGTSNWIVPIVEGRGEEEAVPALLHKLFQYLGVSGFRVRNPIRKHKGDLVTLGGLEKAIELALCRRKTVSAVLVLLDADKDCPAELAQSLLARVSDFPVPVKIVIPKREFETWFLGCLERYRGFMGISDDAQAPPSPEAVGGKGTLKSHMSGKKYIETIHQVEFVKRMEIEDIDLCQKRCPSFDKLVRDVTDLVHMLKS